MRDLIEIARELIRTPSLSGEEREITYLIRDLLGEYGVDKVFIDEYGNVIGVRKGDLGGSIVFEGHMDHVPPGDPSNWKYDPYGAVVVDNKVYGRGAVDMKGAIASMIYSIKDLRDKDIPSTYYVFVPYEEISEGTLFGKALEETLGIKPDLVVLGEATNLNLHRGHRGRAVIETVFHGVSAHASMPDQGLNALKALSKFIDLLTRYSDKLPYHSILGRSSVEPTVVDCSPRSPPIIPDLCRLMIDYRMVVGETRDSIVAYLETIAKTLVNEGLVIDIEISIAVEEAVMWTGKHVSIEHYYPPWINEDHDLLEKILGIIREHRPCATLGVWRFSTDGVYSAGKAGVPTIGVGPGMEELAHKPNEYVVLGDLEIASRIYTGIVHGFREIIY